MTQFERLPHAQWRNGWARIRYPIPKGLQPVLGRTEWLQKLGTTDNDEAVSRYFAAMPLIRAEIRRAHVAKVTGESFEPIETILARVRQTLATRLIFETPPLLIEISDLDRPVGALPGQFRRLATGEAVVPSKAHPEPAEAVPGIVDAPPPEAVSFESVIERWARNKKKDIRAQDNVRRKCGQFAAYLRCGKTSVASLREARTYLDYDMAESLGDKQTTTWTR